MSTLAYEGQLAYIDEMISVHRSQIESLTWERYKLLSKIRNVDMDAVLQCIAEKGLTSGEVLNLINSAS